MRDDTVGEVEIRKPAARLGDSVDCPVHGIVSIVSGSPNTYYNGKPAARIGDTTSCGDTIIEGSSSVSINSKAAAFVGCATAHGGKIISGSPTVLIGARRDTIVTQIGVDPSHLNIEKSSKPKEVQRQINLKTVIAVGTPALSSANGKDPNQNMVASDNAARFTASFEAIGFVAPDGTVRAYQDRGCNKGFWTVGLGEMSGKTKDSTFSTEEEAYNSFVKKIKGEYSQRVKQTLKAAHVKRNLAQYEFDALVDLAYQKGNCKKIVQKIAGGSDLKEADFVAQTGIEHKNRRVAEYNLFSGKNVDVSGHSRYLRMDNTNGGYCPLKNGKKGFKIEQSNKVFTLKY
jgi:uncharacterized Zn-binding protein involved in type VI secretion/GH24 family phage-related lysozyme (muramidase)